MDISSNVVLPYRPAVPHPLGDIFLHDSIVPSPHSSSSSSMAQDISTLRLTLEALARANEELTIDNLRPPGEALLNRFFDEQDSDRQSGAENSSIGSDLQPFCDKGSNTNHLQLVETSPTAPYVKKEIRDHRLACRHPLQGTDGSFGPRHNNCAKEPGNGVPMLDFREPRKFPASSKALKGKTSNVKSWSNLQQPSFPTSEIDGYTQLEAEDIELTGSATLQSLADFHAFCRSSDAGTLSTNENIFTSTAFPEVPSPLRNELQLGKASKRMAYKKKLKHRYSRCKLKKRRANRIALPSSNACSQNELEPYNQELSSQYRTQNSCHMRVPLFKKDNVTSHKSKKWPRHNYSAHVSDQHTNNDYLSDEPVSDDFNNVLQDAILASLKEQVDFLNRQNCQMEETARVLKLQLEEVKQKLIDHVVCDPSILITAIERYGLLLPNDPLPQRVLNVLLNAEEKLESPYASASVPDYMGGEEMLKPNDHQACSFEIAGIQSLKQIVGLTSARDLEDALSIDQPRHYNHISDQESYIKLIEKQCRRYFLSVANLTEDEKVEFVVMSRNQQLECYESWLSKHSKDNLLDKGLDVLHSLSTMEDCKPPVNAASTSQIIKLTPKSLKLRTMRKSKKIVDYFGKDFPGYFPTVSQLHLSPAIGDIDHQESLKPTQQPNRPYTKSIHALSNLHFTTVLENWIHHEFGNQNSLHLLHERYDIIAIGRPLPDPAHSTSLSQYLALDGREFEHFECRRGNGNMAEHTEVTEKAKELPAYLPKMPGVLSLSTPERKHVARYRQPHSQPQCFPKQMSSDLDLEYSGMMSGCQTRSIDDSKDLVQGSNWPLSSANWVWKPVKEKALQRVRSNDTEECRERGCRRGPPDSCRIPSRPGSSKLSLRKSAAKVLLEEISSAQEQSKAKKTGASPRKNGDLNATIIQANERPIRSSPANGLELAFAEQFANSTRAEPGIQTKFFEGDDSETPNNRNTREFDNTLSSIIQAHDVSISKSTLSSPQLLSQGLWSNSQVPTEGAKLGHKISSRNHGQFPLATSVKFDSPERAVTLGKVGPDSCATMSDLLLPPPELCHAEYQPEYDRAQAVVDELRLTMRAKAKDGMVMAPINPCISLPTSLGKANSSDTVSQIEFQEVNNKPDSASKKSIYVHSLNSKENTPPPPKIKKVDFGEATFAPCYDPSVDDSTSSKSLYGKSPHHQTIDAKESGVLVLGDGKHSLKVLGSKLKLKAKSAFGSTGRSSLILRKVSKDYVFGSLTRAGGSLRKKGSEDTMKVV